LQLQRVLSLLGDEFIGHYWQTLLIEIDFELQMHFPLSMTSFLPQTKVQTPLRLVNPELHIHWVPFQTEFNWHSEHWPLIKYKFFFSQTHVFWIESNINPEGHFGIESHASPLIKYPSLHVHLTPDSAHEGSEFKGHLNGIQATFQSLQI